MISMTGQLATKFEIILFFTALMIWSEEKLYDCCRRYILKDFKKECWFWGVISLNAVVLICAIFWSGVWVF